MLIALSPQWLKRCRRIFYYANAIVRGVGLNRVVTNPALRPTRDEPHQGGGIITSVADSSIVVGDEPGDGALDHGSVLAVVGDTGSGAPAGPGGDVEVVVVAGVERLADRSGGATAPGWTVLAAAPEGGGSAGGDVHALTFGTGHGAGVVIDGEVVAVELIGVELPAGVAAQR